MNAGSQHVCPPRGRLTGRRPATATYLHRVTHRLRDREARRLADQRRLAESRFDEASDDARTELGGVDAEREQGDAGRLHAEGRANTLYTAAGVAAKGETTHRTAAGVATK